jgi:hypothetical protein
MNILNIQLPKIDTSFVRSIPYSISQHASSAGRYAWNSLGSLKFQLPHIQANFFPHEKVGYRPLTEMKNDLIIKNFNFKKSLHLTKISSYAR